MNRRNFVQETIDQMRRKANEVEEAYTKFKNKQISAQEFEDVYYMACADLEEDLNDEKNTPNNGCPYVMNDGTTVESPDSLRKKDGK